MKNVIFSLRQGCLGNLEKNNLQDHKNGFDLHTRTARFFYCTFEVDELLRELSDIFNKIDTVVHMFYKVLVKLELHLACKFGFEWLYQPSYCCDIAGSIS